jgi:hypothetical protein
MKYILHYTFMATMLLFSACSKSEAQGDGGSSDDNLQGPVSRPLTGYGSDGNFEVAEIDFPSPEYTQKDVSIFYPKGISSPAPVVFYLHGYGGENKNLWSGIFRFIAKKGYVVVFSPYPTLNSTIEERYNILWRGFTDAVKRYPAIIDSTKTGFMGHSFGGGAAIALAYRAFSERGWGSRGRFIFTMAPWYSYEADNQMLNNFPSDTKLLSQVYEDDSINDHRMAIDIYNNINIPDSEKDFIIVKKSVIQGYTYLAEHDLPSTFKAYDAYDYYSVYRLLDALMDYTFNGSMAGKNVALGNGSAEQITMPGYNGQIMSPLSVTDNPVPEFDQSKYIFKWDSYENPRKSDNTF